MADLYVWSGATGAANGSSWANAYTTLQAANLARSQQDTRVLIANDHLESYNGDLSNGYGSGNDFTTYISVNRAGAVPPTDADFLPGATIRLTKVGTVALDNWCSYEGIRFQIGYGLTSAQSQNIYIQGFGRHTIFRNCYFDLSQFTGASNIGDMGNTGSADLWNCFIKFGAATGQCLSFSAGARVQWNNSGQSIFETGSVIPTAFLVDYADGTCLEFISCDLSAIASPCRMFNRSGGGTPYNRVRNCKLSNTFLINGSYESDGNAGVSPSRCDEIVDCINVAGQVINERHIERGTMVHAYDCYRNGGATAGGAAYSWRGFTQYYSTYHDRGETFEGIAYVSSGGTSKTLTVEVIGAQATALNTRNCWVEVEYPSDATLPYTAMAASHTITGGVLQTAVNLPSSTATWTKPAGVSGSPQKMTVTFTPARPGVVRWRVYYGLDHSWYPPNYAIYIDPAVSIV